MLKLLLNRKVWALPWKFKLFILRYFLSIRNPDNVQKINGGRVLSIYLPPFPSQAFDTFLDAQVRASRGTAVPEIVNISLTSECHNGCWHCLTSEEENELDGDVLLETIGSLKQMGTFQFLFTGGNPLLRDDLETLVSAASGSSVALVSTPGPLDRERAVSLKKAGCQGVLIALEHHEREINDELMGSSGAFERSLDSIENAREAGLLTGTWIVATSETINDMDAYLRFVKEKGVTDVAVFEPMLVDEGYLLDDEDRKYLRELQKASKKVKGYPRIISGPFMDSEEFMGCTAGYNRLHISASGDVYPCDMLRDSWGNINDEDITSIWKRMHDRYSQPICGCIALEKVDEELPEYYNCLIRKGVRRG